MSLQQLKTQVKHKSLYDAGHNWAMQEFKEGRSIHSIRADCVDNNEFDRGAEDALHFLECTTKDEM